MTLKQSEAGWGVLTQSWRATEKLVIVPTQNSDVGGQRKNHSHYVCPKNSTEILFNTLQVRGAVPFQAHNLKTQVRILHLHPKLNLTF